MDHSRTARPSATGRKGDASNAEAARLFERIAELLEAQDASVFRVRAYRNAAASLRSLDRPVSGIYQAGGRSALEDIPAVGRGLASAIAEYLTTGRLGLLERLEGQIAPEDLFVTVPGIGEKLAHRIHDELGIETLEELELAAHDGRLAGIPGIGERRVRSVREVLASRLSRSVRRASRATPYRRLAPDDQPPEPPTVSEILEVDETYRRNAAAGRLRRIAPRRFNPSGEAWLPVLHLDRGERSFQALFSNTALAHRLGRTRDWVVVYCQRDGHEQQFTIVTESQGPLRGKRVIRGREAECFEFYGRNGKP